MPLPKGGRYRTITTSKGPVRLHWSAAGTVNEAKNLTSGKTHTAAEFAADRTRAAAAKRRKKGS